MPCFLCRCPYCTPSCFDLATPYQNYFSGRRLTSSCRYSVTLHRRWHPMAMAMLLGRRGIGLPHMEHLGRLADTLARWRFVRALPLALWLYLSCLMVVWLARLPLLLSLLLLYTNGVDLTTPNSDYFCNQYRYSWLPSDRPR